MSKAAVFRQASEDFNTAVARSQPNWNELGDRAFAEILAENNSPQRELWIRWRCQDAGWVE